MTTPRAYTVEETRENFLATLRNLSFYWSRQDGTMRENCDGLCFSILSLIDGSSASFPAIDLVICPHPDDKEYKKANGDNWYEPGEVFNDCMMHELWHRKERQ